MHLQHLLPVLFWPQWCFGLWEVGVNKTFTVRILDCILSWEVGTSCRVLVFICPHLIKNSYPEDFMEDCLPQKRSLSLFGWVIRFTIMVLTFPFQFQVSRPIERTGIVIWFCSSTMLCFPQSCFLTIYTFYPLFKRWNPVAGIHHWVIFVHIKWNN